MPQCAYNIPFTQRYTLLSCRVGTRGRRYSNAVNERCDRQIHAAGALKGSCGQRRHALTCQRLDELSQGCHATAYDEPQLIQRRASRSARSDPNVRAGQPRTTGCCVASLCERRWMDAGMSLTARFSYVSGRRSEAFWRGVLRTTMGPRQSEPPPNQRRPLTMTMKAVAVTFIAYPKR